MQWWKSKEKSVIEVQAAASPVPFVGQVPCPPIADVSPAFTVPPTTTELLAIITEQHSSITRMESRILFLENALESRFSEKTAHEKSLEDTIMRNVTELTGDVTKLTEHVEEKFEELDDRLDVMESATEDLDDFVKKQEKDIAESFETLTDRSFVLEKSVDTCLLEVAKHVDQHDTALQTINTLLEAHRYSLDTIKEREGNNTARLDLCARWIDYLRENMVEYEGMFSTLRNDVSELRNDISTLNVNTDAFQRQTTGDITAITSFIQKQQAFLVDIARFWGIQINTPVVDPANTGPLTNEHGDIIIDLSLDEESDTESENKNVKRAKKDLSSLCL